MCGSWHSDLLCTLREPKSNGRRIIPEISRVREELFTNQQSSGLQSCDEDTPAGARRAQQKGGSVVHKSEVWVGRESEVFTCYVTLYGCILSEGCFLGGMFAKTHRWASLASLESVK